MRINISFLIIFFTAFNILNAQIIAPYMEVQNDHDFNTIKIDSVISTYHFNHLIGDIDQNFYFTNTSDKIINLRFIVPQNATTNTYCLNATYDNQTVSLNAISSQVIRQEIKNLKSKNSYENQFKTTNLVLLLPNIKPKTQILIKLNRSIIIEPTKLNYNIRIPDAISIRTEEFTETFFSNKKAIPNLVKNKYIFSGDIDLRQVKINNLIPEINKKSNIEWFITDNNPYAKDINYQYQANNINTGLQHFTENECDYILGTIQPPEETKTIMPREYIFIVDASGSMKGKPIEAVKNMIKSTLKQLKNNELFNILLYSTNHENLAYSSIEASPENLNKAFNFIEKEYGKGNVKLNDAINKIQKFNFKPNYNRIITIISDGDLIIDQNINLSIKNQLKNAQFFILGIGNKIDYRAMNYLALTTGTNPIVINNENEIKAKIDDFQKQILQPLLRNIQVQSKNINFNETYPKNFNSYLSTMPIHFVSKNCSKKYPKTLEIAAKNGEENFIKSFSIEKENTSPLTKAIKFYWAKQHIDFLLKDEDRCGEHCKKDGRYRKEIEKIGIEFNISTPYSVLIQNNDYSNFNQDYDTDADGVPDWLDKCPYEKGSILSNGCPVNQLTNEEKEIYIQNISNEIIRTIEFNLDETIIRHEDYKTLDKVIKILRAYPLLNFDIEGHTDARGSKEYNTNLAFNRATAVINYFEANGLNKKRFTIIAKGDTELKHTMCRPAEKCEEWRNRQNRRVEFKLKKD